MRAYIARGLQRERETLLAANAMALAYHDPKKLGQELRKLDARAIVDAGGSFDPQDLIAVLGVMGAVEKP